MEQINDQQRLTEALGQVIKQKIEWDLNGVTVGPEFLSKLKKAIEVLPADQRVQRANKWGMKNGKDPLLSFVTGRMIHLGIFSRKKVPGMAESFLARLHLAANTPAEYNPTPTPQERILNVQTLEDTFDDIQLGERGSSVAYQLLDPIRLSLNGLSLTTKPNDSEDDINRGFTIPKALLGILSALKYPESEQVFKEWLLTKFSPTDKNAEENTAGGIHFLLALVNFSSFLDSASQLELWKPDVELPERGPEVLLRPFYALLNSADWVYAQLRQIDRKMPVLEALEEVKVLIKLRYGEVYEDAQHRKSLHTVRLEALVPNPLRFALWARPLIHSHPEGIYPPQETATALVKMAESIGVKDIQPVLPFAGPELRKRLISEAQKSGLMESSAMLPAVLRQLRRKPWSDAAEIDFATIIGPDITNLELYVLTGTFGPFTKGHKDLIERTIAHMNALPIEERGRVFQRLMLIVPITNIRGLPNYNKNADRIGSLEERVDSMLLQMSDIDQSQVFITTKLQPVDPSLLASTEGRIFETGYDLIERIRARVRLVKGSAGFKSSFDIVMGPDELDWTGSTRKLAHNQRRKVTEPGGVVVVRRGWMLATLRNSQELRDRTGIDTVILTPGTPYSSSSRVLEEIAQTGTTLAVEAAAREFVINHWSPFAINQRSKLPASSEVLSVGEINQRLVR